MRARFVSPLKIINNNKMEFEHRFWIPILRDHLGFIFRKFVPLTDSDAEFIEQTRSLLAIADQLECTLSQVELDDAICFSQKVRNLHLDILEAQIGPNPPRLDISPSEINHYLNETDEYLLILLTVKDKGQVVISPDIHQHKLWLKDTMEHLKLIMTGLDPCEMELRKVAKKLFKKFAALEVKAMFVVGCLRTDPATTKDGALEFVLPKHFLADADFPVATHLTERAVEHVMVYLAFLSEILVLLVNSKILALFDANTIDHMMREEAYYLIKLGENSIVSPIVRQVPAVPPIRC
jgi:hypothetical protein